MHKKIITKFDYLRFLILLLQYKLKEILFRIDYQKSKKVNGKPILTPEEGSCYLYDMISKNKPFFVMRFGSVECDILVSHFTYKCKLRKISNESKAQAKFNAGMFSNNEEGFEVFSNYTANALKQIDGCSYWHIPYVSIFLKMFSNKKITYSNMESLDSFRFKKPWTKALKGKKVLVVSSYAKTIEKQYKNRTLLFDDQNTLPEYTLITYTPIITNGNNKPNYKTWEEALLKMKEDILKLDFDIALLSCGSYGVPLGGFIKESGRSAIYVGGVLQMHYGIIGQRWEHNECKDYINKYWVRSSENKPIDADKIEHGCYW